MMPRTAAIFCLRLTEATELHDHSCTNKEQKHGQRCFLSKTSPKNRKDGEAQGGSHHLHSQRKNDEVACPAERCIVPSQPRFWNVHSDPAAVRCKTRDRRDFTRFRLFTLQCGVIIFLIPSGIMADHFGRASDEYKCSTPLMQARNASVVRVDPWWIRLQDPMALIKRAHWLGIVESSWNRPCVPIFLHKYRHEPDMHNLQTQRSPPRRESALSRPSHGSFATGTCRMLYQ
jgi:hypothetical protein